MPTIRQKEAVKKVMENYGNVSKSMKEVGYSPNSAKNPKSLTDSKGFKELMGEYGLTEKLVSKSLVLDIKKKPQRRVKELELGARILKMTSDDQPQEKPKPELHLHFHQEKILQLVQKVEEDIKKELEK